MSATPRAEAVTERREHEAEPGHEQKRRTQNHPARTTGDRSRYGRGRDGRTRSRGSGQRAWAGDGEQAPPPPRPWAAEVRSQVRRPERLGPGCSAGRGCRRRVPNEASHGQDGHHERFPMGAGEAFAERRQPEARHGANDREPRYRSDHRVHTGARCRHCQATAPTAATVLLPSAARAAACALGKTRWYMSPTGEAGPKQPSQSTHPASQVAYAHNASGAPQGTVHTDRPLRVAPAVPPPRFLQRRPPSSTPASTLNMLFRSPSPVRVVQGHRHDPATTKPATGAEPDVEHVLDVFVVASGPPGDRKGNHRCEQGARGEAKVDHDPSESSSCAASVCSLTPPTSAADDPAVLVEHVGGGKGPHAQGARMSPDVSRRLG